MKASPIFATWCIRWHDPRGRLTTCCPSAIGGSDAQIMGLWVVNCDIYQYIDIKCRYQSINVDYTIKDDMNINNNNKNINIINDIFINKGSSRTWNSVGRLRLSSWGAPLPKGSLRIQIFKENNHQWSFKRQSKCASRICVRSPGWSWGWNRNSNVNSVDRP